MSTSSPSPSTHEPQTLLPEVTRPASVLVINGRPSPVDSPYNINGRSPSGHLLPCSPTPARRYSRDHIPWMTGSQTSLHDEPNSIDRHTPNTESLLQTDSNTTVYTHHSNIPSGPDINTHPNRAAETSSGNPGVNSFPQSAHIQIDASRAEPHQSTPYLLKSSSQLSVSQKSFNSRSSLGRASYREHHGPPARDHTPTPEKVAPTFCSPSSYTLEIAGPEGPAVFGPRFIAPPRADDPNIPGEPFVAGHRFYPMSVDCAIRYENRNTRSVSENDYKIEAMSYQYHKTPEVPPGWIACRHPEGALYFMHDESKTFTEVNICDPDVYEDIEYFRTFLFSELTTEIKNLDLSDSLKVDKVELVLEPKLDELGVMCCYYFVNPPARSVFWLDEWEGDEIFKDCKGVLSTPHKGLAIEAQYWCAAYVIGLIFYRKVTQELKDEVVDMILHATCDHLTSDTSTCPLSVEELKSHLAIVDRIDPEKTGKRGHCAVVIGRVMHAFYRAYFINYYGEECARLNFDQTVHGWRYHPSRLMAVLAPLLFMAPMSKVRLLHRIFVDDIASKERWNTFLTRLNSQFQAISVLATVLLNANVALLPTVKDSPMGNTPQQYLNYMSLVTSMASIILGLGFMGNNRLEERIAPAKVATFLNGLRHKKHGLEILAIIYSLPYAFLMWGMLFFFAAFAAQWFAPGDTVSRAWAGAFILIVAFLVAWSIWTARDSSHQWWFLPEEKKAGHREEAPEDRQVCIGIPWLGFFRSSSTRRPVVSQFHPGETHAMQHTGSSRDLGRQNSVTGPNFWAGPHVT